jgi:hypothetical protein
MKKIIEYAGYRLSRFCFNKIPSYHIELKKDIETVLCLFQKCIYTGSDIDHILFIKKYEKLRRAGHRELMGLEGYNFKRNKYCKLIKLLANHFNYCSIYAK